MTEFFHSVRLDQNKCNGCTNCVKECPTGAIRVKERQAKIRAEKCIDCGVCIKVCKENANYALTDPLTKLDDYDYTIALTTAVLYGQFKQKYEPHKILSALLELGFDDVCEEGNGVRILNRVLPQFLNEEEEISPLISATCPSIVRLIQVSFPEFLPNIIPLQEPMEIVTRDIKKKKAEELDLSLDQIGIFYITSCPAKVTAINSPLGLEESYIDGVISIMDIYRPLIKLINDVKIEPDLNQISKEGIGWVKSGEQQNKHHQFKSSLAVDGIDNVISILEELERGHLQEIDFFEFTACPGGCIGGPLNVENRFIAQVALEKISNQLSMSSIEESLSTEELLQNYKEGEYNISKLIKPRPNSKLDNDIKKAINKLDSLEREESRLPGLDCTACGAPSCRGLAEDIVNGLAKREDCIILLKKKVKRLSQDIMGLVKSEEI